ncbi:MAG TPA: SUF system NifU family Fe-S cluster assembly protein [Mesotoga infera]|uniref:SUF system NifU family Fe-S cluster assembly protein n=1 Tax=Mesotoga infera TaxID=1236046 RepID=A0A7C1GQH3_9BACT|nr:SUF system NifU family Fe-S cluster assembly protein [Mesotoga infera]
MNFEQLYSDFIMYHFKNNTHRGRLEGSTHTVEGSNTSCGDSITLYLIIVRGVVTAMAFEGEGCAISQASASVMTEILEGKSLEEAAATIENFEKMIRGEEYDGSKIGDAAFFEGLKEHPMRAKCAILPWKTVAKALVSN